MWVDTGLDGYLLYPASETAGLPMTMTGLTAELMFADGTTAEIDIGMLEIDWLGAIIAVPELLPNVPSPELTPDTGEVMGLIDVGLLRDSRLSINFRPGGAVIVDNRP